MAARNGAEAVLYLLIGGMALTAASSCLLPKPPPRPVSAGPAGRGRVAGRPVSCLTPEVQVLVHDGYELTDKDYQELLLLHERFGVALPGKYAHRVLSARGS